MRPAFKLEHIHNLYPTLWTRAADFLQVLDTTFSCDDRVVNISPFLSRQTLDMIGAAAFGLDFQSVCCPGNPFTTHYFNGFSTSQRASVNILLSSFLPSWMLKVLPLRGPRKVGHAIGSVRRRLFDLAEQRICERQTIKDVAEHSIPMDILGVAIAAGVIDRDALVDQCAAFLGGGQETTASALSWALYELSRHPHTQEKLRQEVRENVKPPSCCQDESAISLSSVQKLRYLNAVCNESLRLHAPIPILIRAAIETVTVGGIPCPKGSTFKLSPWIFGHSPELWSTSDLFEFDPDRWLNDPRGGAGYQDMTFSGGPRACVGERFAKAGMATILAALVGRYQFDFVGTGEELNTDPELVRVEKGITAKIEGGLRVGSLPYPERRTVLVGLETWLAVLSD